MKLERSPDGTVRAAQKLATGEVLTILAENTRRERTGLHALIAILLQDSILAHDIFNVGRSEERGRLAKSAYAQVEGLAKEAYSERQLRHDLDVFCMLLERHWEGRFVVEPLAGKRREQGQTYILKPWVLQGGGTILFAPPKSGKSQMALLMAQSINAGVSLLWPVKKQPVRFINLERSRESLAHRLAAVNMVLGLPEETPLPMLNARGQSLSSIAESIRRLPEKSVGFLDSISRAGAGSMVADDVANSIIDMLNNLFPSWLAVGHTPRGGDHIYGSIHFEAGQDLGVLLKSQMRDNQLGIMLKGLPANDIPTPATAYYTLKFGEQGDVSSLVSVSVGQVRDWPELALSEGMSPIQRIEAWLDEHTRGTTTELAKALHMDAAQVSKFVKHSGKFEPAGKEGRNIFYQVKPRPATPATDPWDTQE